MIDNDDTSPDSQDVDFAGKINLLRGIEPTVASRVKNRTVIAAALACRNSGAAPAAWWRRSVSIPVPVAMAACVVFLASVLLWLPRLKDAAVGAESVAGSTVAEHQGASNTTETSLNSGEDDDTPLEYRASATYVCGVGRISYESAYYFQED
jgi:hypothetical protein